jgi:hypothetical protein
VENEVMGEWLGSGLNEQLFNTITDCLTAVYVPNRKELGWLLASELKMRLYDTVERGEA